MPKNFIFICVWNTKTEPVNHEWQTPAVLTSSDGMVHNIVFHRDSLGVVHADGRSIVEVKRTAPDIAWLNVRHHS